MGNRIKAGVLALQGAFREHIQTMERLGAECIEIRKKEDLSRGFDCLILPGGESTVQCRLLRELNMYGCIRDMISSGMPVYGTCAGMILLAKNVVNDSPDTLKLMDITVMRNAYGRQSGSFFTFGSFGEISQVGMPFIRAPYILEYGNDVQALSFTDGKCTAARQNNMLVTSFHPELTDETAVHEYFINMVN